VPAEAGQPTVREDPGDERLATAENEPFRNAWNALEAAKRRAFERCTGRAFQALREMGFHEEPPALGWVSAQMIAILDRIGLPPTARPGDVRAKMLADLDEIVTGERARLRGFFFGNWRRFGHPTIPLPKRGPGRRPNVPPPTGR